MNQTICDLCYKVIKEKVDIHSIQISKYDQTVHQTIVTNHGDYHLRCMQEIFRKARQEILINV